MAYNQKEDDYWWKLFCKGEKAALEFFYKKHYNLLYNYGLKLLNDPELIRDFIQDIFYKLCKRSRNVEITDLKVYLLRAMRNIIYDYYAVRKEAVSMEEMSFMIPEDDTVFNSFFSKDDEDIRKWKSVLDAINALPNQQKQILYLYYVKGLTHKEISEVLEINPQSSMNALSKSIRKLRLSLNDDTLILILFLSLLK